MSPVHYRPLGDDRGVVCGATPLSLDFTRRFGLVTCFACRRHPTFRLDQLGTDVRPSVKKGNAMSASIEWGHTSNATTAILGHFDTAGDNQSIADDSDNPEEIGLAFGGGGDGYILVGTPVELLALLARATAQVAEHLGGEG